MLTNAFLTPDSLTQVPELAVTMTVNQGLVRFIYGALDILGEEANWEQFGAVTPEEASQYFLQLLVNLQVGEVSMTPRLVFHGFPDSDIFVHSFANVVFSPLSFWDATVIDRNAQTLTILRDGIYAISHWARSDALTGQLVSNISSYISVNGTQVNDGWGASSAAIQTTAGNTFYKRLFNTNTLVQSITSELADGPNFQWENVGLSIAFLGDI